MLNWMEQMETLQPWVSSGVRCWQDVFVLRWGGRCWEMAEGVRVERETTTMTMLVVRRREDCSARVDGLKRPRGKCQQNNHYENCNCSSDFTLSFTQKTLESSLFGARLHVIQFNMNGRELWSRWRKKESSYYIQDVSQYSIHQPTNKS